MGTKKKLPLVENLEVTDIAAEGKSIARLDNMVVFIPGLVPGDIANVQISRRRKKYMEGYVVELKKKSANRNEPFCGHFGTCGGCKWQILPYEQQLLFKEKQVVDQLQRIGKTAIPAINPIIGSPQQQFYRNKLEFTYTASRWLTAEEIKSGKEVEDKRGLGFHLPGKYNRVLNIDQCFLQHDRSNQIRNAIREFTIKNNYEYNNPVTQTGFLRNLIIRNTEFGEWMVIVVFRYEDTKRIHRLMDMIRNDFPFITSLHYVINSKLNDTINDLEIHLFSGRDHIFEELTGMKFKIGPRSFFQTNTLQARKLYKIVLKFAELNDDELVYDLYTGTGTIAIFIAQHCKKVVGIEAVEAAIEDARINSQINNIKNTVFTTGDIKEVLKSDFFAEYGKPDVIITDPPRSGMHKSVIEAITEASPKKIVYVSCNPATQARDIQLMSRLYRVNMVQPLDMFPHTHHVENVIRLDRI